MASDFETIFCDENINPVIKLEPISITDEENSNDAIDKSSTTAEDMKIGEIFRVSQNHLKFVCVHCPAEFPLLMQFTAHIERHLQQIYAVAMDQKLPINDFEHVDLMPMLVDCNVSFSDANDATIGNYSRNSIDGLQHYPPEQQYPLEQQYQSKKHKCTDCNESFSQPYYLKKHRAIVHKGRVYLCTVCHIEVTHKQNMFRHMRNKHPTVDVNAFSEVYKEANDDNAGDYDDDQSGMEQADDRIDTIDVLFSAKNTNKRPKIIKPTLASGPLQCSDCDHSFPSKSYLEKHYEIVHKGRLFSCSVCHMKLTHKHNMFRHMRNKHPTVDVNAFSEVYKEANDVNAGDYDDDQSGMEQADDRIDTIDVLFRPKKTNKRPKIIKPTLASGPLKCSDCDHSFERKSYLEKHYEIVHKGRLFSCSVCHMKLTHKQNMFRHMRNQHPTVDVNAFEAIYDRTNPNVKLKRMPANRMKNRKKHTNGIKQISVKRNASGGFECSSDCDEEKIYCCTICNTKLMYKRNMFRHVRNKHPANHVYSFIELNSNRSGYADNQAIIDYNIKTEIIS